MSNTSLPESRALPRYPLLSTLPLTSTSGQRDALEDAASILIMLADFIGGTQCDETLEILPRAHAGLWRQLLMVAKTLDKSGLTAKSPEETSPRQIVAFASLAIGMAPAPGA